MFWKNHLRDVDFSENALKAVPLGLFQLDVSVPCPFLPLWGEPCPWSCPWPCLWPCPCKLQLVLPAKTLVVLKGLGTAGCWDAEIRLCEGASWWLAAQPSNPLTCRKAPHGAGC